jgi:hypothetical protein
MAMNKSALSSAMLSKIKGAGIQDKQDQWKKVCDALAEAIVDHIKQTAEVTIPTGSILPGTVAIGAGPTAAPNPAPIPIQQPPAPPGSIK